MVSAQVIQTGVIAGQVVDQETNPIPGAVITVKLDSIISQTVSTISDSEGTFRIPGLPPGIYRVEVELQEYFQEKSILVNLRVGNVETVTIVMHESTANSAAMETAVGPMVFLSSVGINETFDKHSIQHIPIASDSYIYLVQLLPGNTLIGRLLSTHGMDIRSNAYLLDGSNFNDPHSGLPALELDLKAVDSVEATTGGRSVQWGKASGAAMNLITRKGSNGRHGELSFLHQSDNVSHRNPKDSNESEIENTRMFASLGGSILGTSLWLQSNFAQRWLEYADQVNPLSPIDDDTYTFESRATLSTSPSNIFMLRYIKEDLRDLNRFSPNMALWTVLESDNSKVTSDYFRKADFLTAGDVFRLSEIMELSISASWLFIKNDVLPTSGAESISSIVDPKNNIILQGTYLDVWNKRQSNKFQLDGGINYYLDELAGTHNITLGFEYERSKADSNWGFNNKISISFRDGERYYRQYFTGEDGAPSDVRSEILINRFSIYGQDSWHPHSRFMINFGIRYNGPRVENRFARTINWDDISPRISFNLDLFGTGKTILRIGFSRYNEAAIASRALTDPYGIATQFWEESVVEGGEKQWASKYDTFVHFGYGSDTWYQADLNTVAPSTDEYFLSLEHEVLDSFVVALNVLSKRSKDITEDFENLEDALVSDWQRYSPAGAVDFQGNSYFYWITFPRSNGNYSPVLVWDNDDRLFREYFGFELSARTRLISGFQMYGNYTWSSTRGNIDVTSEESSGFSVSQNTHSRFYNAEGYLSSDHRHSLNLVALYAPRADMHLGAIFTYRTGNPFNKFLYNPDIFSRMYEIRSDPRGSVYRLDDVIQLDVRLERSIFVGPTRFNVVLDIFNLLNGRAVTKRMEKDTAQFGEPLKRQQTRTYQIGIRYFF